MPFFQNIPASLVLQRLTEEWTPQRQLLPTVTVERPLPVGHELQNLDEELPQAFPPHLAFQLHLVAGEESRHEHAETAGRVPGACGPRQPTHSDRTVPRWSARAAPVSPHTAPQAGTPTSTGLHPHTPRQTGSEKRQQGRNCFPKQ